MRTAARAGALAALCLSMLACARSAQAGPSDYVASPIVEEGEREIDFKSGLAREPDGRLNKAHSLGLGLGVNAHWFTEVYAKWHQEPGGPAGFDAWEWENKFQLTETGRYPVDVGLLLEIERPLDRREGCELRWGPLLQADIGPQWQGNLNLWFEKHLRGDDGAQALLGYQWQLKYRWQPALEWGLQGFGELGPWREWAAASAQTHNLGPALFGKIDLGGRRVLVANAAWLRGLNQGTPSNTFRLQAELEF